MEGSLGEQSASLGSSPDEILHYEALPTPPVTSQVVPAPLLQGKAPRRTLSAPAPVQVTPRVTALWEEFHTQETLSGRRGSREELTPLPISERTLHSATLEAGVFSAKPRSGLLVTLSQVLDSLLPLGQDPRSIPVSAHSSAVGFQEGASRFLNNLG